MRNLAILVGTIATLAVVLFGSYFTVRMLRPDWSPDAHAVVSIWCAVTCMFVVMGVVTMRSRG